VNVLKDFSLHLLDLAQNSLRAAATVIRFNFEEDVTENRLNIEIEDNGRGMNPVAIKKAVDPFFTTRTTRKVGLGVSLFAAAAKRCGGEFAISSMPGKGTKLTASFLLNHWDTPPMGDMAGTLITLIAGNPKVDFIYRHRRGNAEYLFDTRNIKELLEDVPISSPTVLAYLEEHLRNGLIQMEIL
jgi:hypothetical protein